MSTTLLSLILLCSAAAPVETASTPDTLLYVRTTPAGAEIRLDGRPLGTSDGLFRVKPGAYKIVVDLENYQPQEQQITIRDGRITRIELKFKTQPKASPKTAAAPRGQRPRHSVTLVAGKDRMTFEGRATTWQELPGLLQKVPDRRRTVLQIARAPEEMTSQQWDEAESRAGRLVQRFGFEYLSYVGEQPFGSKGGPSQAVPEGKARPPAEPSTEIPARSIWERVMNPPEGWKVEKSFIVPPAQTAAIERKVGGQINRLSNTVFSAHGQQVQVNLIEGRTPADAARIHQAVLAMKGDPAYALRFDNTIVEFVGTFDVAFAKRAARELGLQPKPDEPKGVSFGAVKEETLRDPEKRVAELLDLDTGRRAITKVFGSDDRQTHRWIRERGMDAVGIRAAGSVGVLLFDVAVYENPSVRWETVTAEEVARHKLLAQTEPNPIRPVGAEDLSELPKTCLFRTREGSLGVLQVSSPEGTDWVKIRYKLVIPSAERAVAEVHLGRLELRVAPTRGGDAKITLPEGEIKRYVKQLEAEGPERGRKRGDPFAWFPLRSEPYSGLITAEYRDFPFVLLSNRPGEIMLSRSGDPAPWGLKEVSAVEDERGRPAIDIEFDDDGAQRLEKLTEAHLHSPLAMLVDDQVMAAPTIHSKIGRRTLIVGRFTLKEVNDLVDVLRASMVPPRRPLTIQCPLDGTVAPLGKLALTRRQHDAVKQWLKTQTPPLSPAKFGQFLNTILDDQQRAILKTITASFEQPAEPPTGTVQPATPDATVGEPKLRKRYAVQLVVGKDRMTFEGQETTWEKLPALLEKVPNRKHTVLAIAVASDEVTLKEKNDAIGRAETLARRFGFEHLSFVGVHPLGSKAGAPQLVPDASVVPKAAGL